MKKLLGTFLICITLALSQLASAGSIEDGQAAYDGGDYRTALSLLRPLATQGNANAETTLGIMYSYGRGTPQDFKEAVKWFRLAAEQGYARAQFDLGHAYNDGQGVQQDYKEALKWYRLAADQGYPYAQTSLGLMYLNGQGVTQDYKEALKWYRLAADQGEANAQNTLGNIYYGGQGVQQDYKEALNWYRLSATQGAAYAETMLGVIYAKGQGVPKDLNEAVKWFRLAAEQGDPIAQYTLGNIYAGGQDGIPRDSKEASKWFQLAANQGYADAKEKLAENQNPQTVQTFAQPEYSEQNTDQQQAFDPGGNNTPARFYFFAIFASIIVFIILFSRYMAKKNKLDSLEDTKSHQGAAERKPIKPGTVMFILMALLFAVVYLPAVLRTETPEEKAQDVEREKRIHADNKERDDTLEKASLVALLFDPHLKYELGVFHALDLTLSSLDAARASAIANKLCGTYHVSGGLRVYLADGHLAAQCDFLPEIEKTTAPIFNPSPQCAAEEQIIQPSFDEMVKSRIVGMDAWYSYVDARTSQICKDAKAAHTIAWKNWYDQTTQEQRDAQAKNTDQACSSEWPIACTHGF